METDKGSFIFASALGVSPTGAVYVYRQDDATRSWVLDSRILPDLPISGEGFGAQLSAVEAEAGGIVVASSARNAEINGLYAAGAVYVLHRESVNADWKEVAKLGRKEPVYLAYNGREDVAITTEGTVLMSAESDFSTVATGRVPRAGSAYRFEVGRLLPVSTSPAPPEASGAHLRVTPNPASGAVTLGYTIASAGEVSVVVYDALGRAVAVAARGQHTAGKHEVRVDIGSLAVGVYMARLVAGDMVWGERFTVVR